MTWADIPEMPPDQRLRPQCFASPLGRLDRDVPRMCPVWLRDVADDVAIFVLFRQG